MHNSLSQCAALTPVTICEKKVIAQKIISRQNKPITQKINSLESYIPILMYYNMLLHHKMRHNYADKYDCLTK